jgi:hypothetical protein
MKMARLQYFERSFSTVPTGLQIWMYLGPRDKSLGYFHFVPPGHQPFQLNLMT